MLLVRVLVDWVLKLMHFTEMCFFSWLINNRLIFNINSHYQNQPYLSQQNKASKSLQFQVSTQFITFQQVCQLKSNIKYACILKCWSTILKRSCRIQTYIKSPEYIYTIVLEVTSHLFLLTVTPHTLLCLYIRNVFLNIWDTFIARTSIARRNHIGIIKISVI